MPFSDSHWTIRFKALALTLAGCDQALANALGSRYKDQKIWPRPEGLHVNRPIYPADRARTHYRIYDALRRGGASRDEVEFAARVVLTEFPNSRYAKLVEQQEVAEDCKMTTVPAS